MTNAELKALRVSLKWTQQQLAERLELSAGHIARLEMPANGGRWPVPKWMARELRRLATTANRP